MTSSNPYLSGNFAPVHEEITAFDLPVALGVLALLMAGCATAPPPKLPAPPEPPPREEPPRDHGATASCAMERSAERSCTGALS